MIRSPRSSSDATRTREFLEQLGRSDASITDLAGKFQMTLTGMKKHVGVLEEAGLVTTEKVGARADLQARPRVNWRKETAWLERYHQLLGFHAFYALDKVVEELKRKEKNRWTQEETLSPTPMRNRTTVEPKSERELVVTRTFDAPARIVFQAWTTPAPLQALVGAEVDGR